MYIAHHSIYGKFEIVQCCSILSEQGQQLE